MSDSVPEQNNNVSQEEVSLAEAAEQAALNDSQKSYLLKRVVLLRVQNNRLQADLQAALQELEQLRPAPEDTPED